MIQQDRLFILIKSLTTGEKTYFSKYSRIHQAKEKPDYLRLFEFIDTQEEYDEKAVKKHFKKEKFITQLPRKKTQLKDKIMESLTIFHADRTVETSLRRQMVLLPVLYEKASNHKDLVKDFEKQVKNIKKTAEEHECFSVLIELFEWEKLLLKLLDDNKKKGKIIALLDNRKIYQNKLNMELDLGGAATRTTHIIAKDPKIKELGSRKEFKESVINVLKKNKCNELSVVAQRHYYYAESGYYRFLDDWEGSHKAAESLINTYSNTNIAEVDIAAYKKYLCYYLAISEYAQKRNDYVDILNKLKFLSLKNDVKTFNTVHFKLLIYNLANNEFEAAAKTADEIEEMWEDLCEFIPKRRQLAYHYNMIVAYWLSGRLKEAVWWLSKILNFEQSNEGQRYVNQSRIIQFPIYYDSGDLNLDNRIDSARKVLYSRKVLENYRQVIISYFRKLIRCVGRREKEKCFVDMKTKLSEIQNEQNVKAPDLEGVLFWCESKLTK